MKKRFIVIVCILSLMMLISCTSEKITVNDESSLVIENYDRKIVIDEVPEKVLTLGPNCTELFVALGLEKYVIGRTLVNHSSKPLEGLEQVTDIPILNYAEATREAILTSGADFIYAIDWEISDVGCNIEEVNEFGMNVYVNAAKTLEEQFKEIEDIGKIFNISEITEKFIEDQKVRIQAVNDKIKDENPPKILVYDSGNDGVFTSSGENFETLLINLAGGKNIFDDLTDKQWVTVGYEEILRRNPDMILIHNYDYIPVEEKIKEIKANPVLSLLDCVKNDQFVVIDLESVLPGNRMANTVEFLGKSFHSEKFKE